ncbi:MAG: sensor histidine kinase, partial [Mucilaginibacter sp.]|nr:sensor histidine kinase [Mucilaginibacter sp.]
MKKKLKIILVLITLSLTGIIVFQTYWSINAYEVNKKNFDANIDVAMQRALDSCKKDYFDSIRVVMVKRLSDTNVAIKIDTIRSITYQKHFSPGVITHVTPATKENDANAAISIWISNKHSESSDPISTSVPIYNYYKNRLGP